MYGFNCIPFKTSPPTSTFPFRRCCDAFSLRWQSVLNATLSALPHKASKVLMLTFTTLFLCSLIRLKAIFQRQTDRRTFSLQSGSSWEWALCLLSDRPISIANCFWWHLTVQPWQCYYHLWAGLRLCGGSAWHAHSWRAAWLHCWHLFAVWQTLWGWRKCETRKKGWLFVITKG